MPELTGESLLGVTSALRDAGARRIYLKVLAANDNSKNQVYLGGDLRALNMLPFGGVQGERGSHGEPIFKAELAFGWLTSNGRTAPAPGAQLILYPQYPEVRLSGFLRGCEAPPTDLMGQHARIPGRVLLLGITLEGRIVAHVVAPGSRVANELRALGLRDDGPILVDSADLGHDNGSRGVLLRVLRSVHRKGWIVPRRLRADGSSVPSKGPNSGGYTLEAELGVSANGYSEPDYMGWELKQHQSAGGDGISGATLTLMTPEPTGGLYVDSGAKEFVLQYGYPDKRGREGRLNFGGLHHVDRTAASTGLTMRLIGYDAAAGVITDAGGAVALLDSNDRLAASWSFGGLLKHWSRKHSAAAYVESAKRAEPLAYRFGPRARLAEGTDFGLLLKAFAVGRVFYDPGIKLVRAGGKEELKRRSQFRVRGRDLASLYDSFETLDLS